jgi:myosin heavy subunit
VFKLEEQLYDREGIPWDPLDFPDNQDAVEIITAKGTGIFSKLDEECSVPGGSDVNFCNKLIKQHKGHRRFDEIKVKPTWFVVKHFAGPVPYCTDSFLDKNKDQLSGDLIQCFGNSTNAFVSKLFRGDRKFEEFFAEQEDTGGAHKKKQKYTVSSEFKDQLNSLMNIVDLTEPHFIRCIKPNPQNEPDKYDRKAVTEQLRYGGVLQVVQVSRAGYPVRISHRECWDDYKVIANSKTVEGLKHLDDPKIRAQKLMEHLNTELNIPPGNHGFKSWAVGKTLVFFKQSAFERVKFARLDLIKSSTIIQANWRRKVRREMYRDILLCDRHLQALLRGKQARLDLQHRRQQIGAAKIQSLWRRTKQKMDFLKIRQKNCTIAGVEEVHTCKA